MDSLAQLTLQTADLHQHTDVAQAAAVGRPDAYAGEVPVAYVQRRPGSQVSAEELEGFAQDNIGDRAAWPKEIILVDELPTTTVGKRLSR